MDFVVRHFVLDGVCPYFAFVVVALHGAYFAPTHLGLADLQSHGL